MSATLTRTRPQTLSDLADDLVAGGWVAGLPDLPGDELDRLYDGPAEMACPACGEVAETIWLHREKRGLFGSSEEGRVLAICGRCGAASVVG
jgi:hypothetical protein